MSMAPQRGASQRRRWGTAVLVALTLSACDVTPLGAGGRDHPGTPVETVTALEVDVEDLLVDDAPRRRRRPVAPQP